MPTFFINGCDQTQEIIRSLLAEHMLQDRAQARRMVLGQIIVKIGLLLTLISIFA